MLMMLHFLHMLPTFHPRAWLVLAAKVGLLKRCCWPGISVLTLSSSFPGPLENPTLAFVHLTVFLTFWVLIKLPHASQASLEEGKSRVFFPSFFSFPFSLFLCLFFPGLRVIYYLPCLWNMFLSIMFLCVCCDRQALLVRCKCTGCFRSALANWDPWTYIIGISQVLPWNAEFQAMTQIYWIWICI